MTAGALKRACHHVCKQPRSAPLNPQTWLYGVSSRMGGERRAGCQERAGAGVAQSGGCHIRGQHMSTNSSGDDANFTILAPKVILCFLLLRRRLSPPFCTAMLKGGPALWACHAAAVGAAAGART